MFKVALLAHPDLGPAQGLGRLQALAPPQVVEAGHEHHRAPVAHRPQRGHHAGHPRLNQPRGQGDDLIGQFCAGDAGLTGGEDGQAGLCQAQGQDFGQGEHLVVGQEQPALQRSVEPGQAVAGKVQHGVVPQLLADGLFGGGLTAQHLAPLR